MRDLRLQLKPEHENAFNHGWLAAHFGWARSPLLGGVVNAANESAVSPERMKTLRDGWLLGFDTAIETDETERCIALSKMTHLEFD
jgi:hypothetical protein